MFHEGSRLCQEDMLASSNARNKKLVQMAVNDLRESANCRTSKLQQEALTMQDSTSSVKAEWMIHMERTESNYHEDTSAVESGKQDLAEVLQICLNKAEAGSQQWRNAQESLLCLEKRIAAKSSSVTSHSLAASHVTKREVPTKHSPSSHKGSKFSDSEPGPSSPLQRFPTRIASVGSADSSKTSKNSRLSTRNHLNEKKLSQSVSSLPESKLEKSDSATKAKASDGPESKKISAIVNHDKSKIAALPELKVKTSKASSIVQNVSPMKVKTQKLNDNKSPTNSEGTNSMLKKKETGISSIDDGDDNPVIEKTVVMLECEEKSYAPAIFAPMKEYDSAKVKEKPSIAAYKSVSKLSNPT